MIRQALAPGAREQLGPLVASRDMMHLSAALDSELTLAGQETSAVVMIAGAARGEGCTTTALGLALRASASDGGRRVLLVDASDGDAQRALGIPDDSPGYAELMDEGANLALVETVSTTGVENLRVLARGRTGRDRRTLSRPLERILAQARGAFDLVVIDAPAILDDPASLVLAQGAGQILFVVRQAGLSAADLETATEEVRRTGGRLFGCVLTSRRPGRFRRRRS